MQLQRLVEHQTRLQQVIEYPKNGHFGGGHCAGNRNISFTADATGYAVRCTDMDGGAWSPAPEPPAVAVAGPLGDDKSGSAATLLLFFGGFAAGGGVGGFSSSPTLPLSLSEPSSLPLSEAGEQAI